MEEKIYALRNSSFWYDDEFYFFLMGSSDHIGHITVIFEDKEQAIQEWKRLEYEFTHHVDFDNFMREDISYNVEEILPHRTWDDLRKLDIEELFEVIHKNDLHAYYLYEYPKNIQQCVIWNKKENNYNICEATTDYDFRTNNFIDACFLRDEPLAKYIYPSAHDSYHILNGTLTELSDTPILLSQLIQQDEYLEYDESTQKLTIQPYINTINSLNTLLKNPIRFLTIEEIYQLEKQINHTHNDDYRYTSGD